MSNSTCVICQDDIKDCSMIILKCNHKYHLNCYTQYIIQSATSKNCPLCRQKIEKCNVIEEINKKTEEDEKKIKDLEQTWFLCNKRIRELDAEIQRLISHNEILRGANDCATDEMLKMNEELQAEKARTAFYLMKINRLKTLNCGLKNEKFILYKKNKQLIEEIKYTKKFKQFNYSLQKNNSYLLRKNKKLLKEINAIKGKENV